VNLPVLLGQVADREFEEAAFWYEQQAALGASFVERVQDTLDQIARSPELHPVIHQGIRRARVQRFPYSVFYRILDDRIEVIAVFHDKRDPLIWQGRT
jgi:plasmid stabilization system protein ParE